MGPARGREAAQSGHCMGNVLGCCDPRNVALRRDLLLEEEAEELQMEKTSSSSPRDEGAEAKTAEPEPKRLKSQEGGAAARLPQDASVEMQAQHDEEKSGATVAPEQVKLEPQGNPLAAPPPTSAGAQQGKRHIGLLRHSARVDNPDDAAKADLDDPRPRSPIAAPAPSLSSLPLCLPRSSAAMAGRAR